MWPVVAGVVVVAVLILGAKKGRERQMRQEEDLRVREMEDRRRRELGEELVPGSAEPLLAEGDRKSAALR